MYLTHPDLESYWGLDTETDGLDPSKIWVCVVKNIKTGETRHLYNEEEFKSWYKNYKIVGHNVISFDVPVLNRLWSAGIAFDRCVDTLVLSYLYNPGIERPEALSKGSGPHSLEAWGLRLKFPKSDFSDWSHHSKGMDDYCLNDVLLTIKVFNALTKRMREYGWSEKSCEIEHKIRIIIDEQQRHGFWFDRERAKDFLRDLRLRQADLSLQIQRLFPPVRTLLARHPLRRTKDGSPHAAYDKALSKYHDVVLIEEGGGEFYNIYELKEFNIGSPKQRVEKLLGLGYKPDKFTPTGLPKVDEDALLVFAKACGRPEVQAMSEWLVLEGRSNMIETWLDHVREDSRIHGKILSCGATTRRMIHSSPNTANIPSGAKAKYGHECRSFWGVTPGRNLCLVGYDAAGLETAGLCHYLNNPVATSILLKPKPDDVHTANARALTEALGRPVDREWGAKTSWYAWLYGAYPPKLGTIVKGPPSDGDIIVETFYQNVPGLKGLKQEIEYEFKHNRGRLETIDGGFVWCPSLNAALNYKIQSAGAITMKLAAILLDEEGRKLLIPFNKVGDIHDEGQLETPIEYADRLGHLAVDSISKAGVALRWRVPLSGDYKVGQSWAETH